MRKASTVLAILGFGLFVAYLLFSSLALDQVGCEVCVAFRDQTSCRTASGTTREEAINTATDNACAQIVSGREATMACTATTPTKISCTEK